MSVPTSDPEAADGHLALLADGSAVRVRRLGPADHAAVDALHRALPRDDRYLRFFTVSRFNSAAVADVIVAEDAVAVGAFRGERLLGAAHFRPDPRTPDPELAVAVAHDEQGRGVASLLLEHLISAARAAGVPRLAAEVLAINTDMLRVIEDSGLAVTSSQEGDVLHMELQVPVAHGLDRPAERFVDAVLEREARADVASLRPVLEPASVVVIGAGRRQESVGRMVLRQIVEGGFVGPVYAVNPNAGAVSGVPCRPSVADLPAGVDLAVLCVPAAAVPGVAEECGRHGIRALLVITAGVSTDAALAAGLASALERYGMRLVGPNCLGMVNTDPRVSLQASFAATVVAGEVGLAAQSGGVAIALTAELGRLGLGVSSMVSMGDATDVNGDDLLLWWGEDGRTTAAVLYVESLRRPRRFARLARRLTRRMPVLTVRSGSSEAGRMAAASHTAGTATPRVVRDALFAQAGLIAVDELAELPGMLALLCWQPLARGRRVGVLSNAGGAGVLAADACARYGLMLDGLAAATREELARLLPAGAAVANPVDATATVSPETFGAAAARLLADPDVDAVLVLSATTNAGDPMAGIGAVADGRPGKPIVAVRLGQAETVGRLVVTNGPAGQVAVPVFADPATAARALSASVRRADWLRRSAVPAAPPPGVDAVAAAAVVAAALAERPEGGWLAPEQAVALVTAAGIPLAATTVVQSARAAVARWRELGRPVALKADVPGVLHKSRAGAVRTGLDSARQIAATVHEFRARFGDGLRGIVVQPMAQPGPELLIGVTSDPLTGPMLTLGLGGTSTDLIDDRTHCLLPATDDDLDDVLGRLRAAPRLLAGDGGAANRAGAREVAARIGWLGALLPELAEAEINPLVLAADGPVAVDVRIRLAPAAPTDPWLRHLPV